MKINFNSKLIEFLRLYETDDQIINNCLISLEEILNTIFPLPRNILNSEEIDYSRIYNCALISCYISLKIKVNSFYSIVLNIIILLTKEFRLDKDILFNHFSSKGLFLEQNIEKNISLDLMKNHDKTEIIIDNNSSNSVEFIPLDSIKIYDMFISNNIYPIGLNQNYYTSECKKIILYLILYKKKITTINKREMICYHYTDKKNLNSILEKGIISDIKNKYKYVYCCLEDNGIFDNDQVLDYAPYTYFGDLVLKIKCTIDDICMWTGGYIGEINLKEVQVQVLFKKIDPLLICDYKIIKIKNKPEIIVTDSNKNSNIKINEKNINKKNIVYDSNNLKIQKYFYYEELFKYDIKKEKSIILDFKNINLINKSLFSNYRIFEIYSENNLLLSISYSNDSINEEVKDRICFHSEYGKKEMEKKFISYKKSNPKIIENIRLLIHDNKIFILTIPKESNMRSMIINDPFIITDDFNEIYLGLGSKKLNTSTFLVEEIRAYEISNDDINNEE